MQIAYKTFWIRDWQPADRQLATQVIAQVLGEHGLSWEPEGADQDAVQVETYYWQSQGEFWVVEQAGELVGTAGYYPITHGQQAVEIRKMYLLPRARGQGLGQFLLSQLEVEIATQGFQEIWLETASVLKSAIALYEHSGYLPLDQVVTPRCDRAYRKQL